MLTRFFVNRAALNADIIKYSLIERINNQKKDLILIKEQKKDLVPVKEENPKTVVAPHECICKYLKK